MLSWHAVELPLFVRGSRGSGAGAGAGGGGGAGGASAPFGKDMPEGFMRI